MFSFIGMTGSHLKTMTFCGKLWRRMSRKRTKSQSLHGYSPPPPTLAELCFAVIRQHKVLERVLDPLKLVKRTNATNTDNDGQAENDDTMSLLSFEDPISSDEVMNMDSDDTSGQNEVWATRLPTYTPPPHRLVLWGLTLLPWNSTNW